MLDSIGSAGFRRVSYLVALERGFLDSILDRLVVAPFTSAARRLTRMDRWLCGAVIRVPRLDLAAGDECRDE